MYAVLGVCVPLVRVRVPVDRPTAVTELNNL